MTAPGYTLLELCERRPISIHADEIHLIQDAFARPTIKELAAFYESRSDRKDREAFVFLAWRALSHDSALELTKEVVMRPYANKLNEEAANQLADRVNDRTEHLEKMRVDAQQQALQLKSDLHAMKEERDTQSERAHREYENGKRLAGDILALNETVKQQQERIDMQESIIDDLNEESFAMHKRVLALTDVIVALTGIQEPKENDEHDEYAND